MANTETMRPALMASENVQSYLVSVKYQDKDGEYADIHDGALVVVGDLAPNDPYNIGTRNGVTIEGKKDDNVYLAKAPTATTDRVVIVDLAEVQGGTIGGNYYKMGIKLYGLTMQAGLPARARIPQYFDKYWLSDDCFVSGDGATAPAVGLYAVPTVGDTHHTVVTNVATEGYCVKIEDTREFVVGNTAIGKLYLCRVVL